MEPSTVPGHVRAFGITDVFADAVRSWWRRIRVHLAFNAAFVAALSSLICLLGCFVAGMIGVALRGTRAGSGFDQATMVAVGILYLAILAIALVSFSFHHGFTLEVTGSDLRGDSPTFADAFRRAGRAIHRHVGAALIRALLDFSTLCLVGGVVGAIAASRATPDSAAGSFDDAGARFAIVVVVFYVVQILWVCAVRGFLGLTAAAVQLEGRGVFDALRRSIDLLGGRRLQFVGLRVVWGLTFLMIVVVAYLPILGFAFAANGGDGGAILAVILLPYMLVFYGLMLMLYSFDSALEAAYHARVVPSNVPAEDLAEVFG